MKSKLVSLIEMWTVGKSLSLLVAPKEILETWSSPGMPRVYRRMIYYFERRPTTLLVVSALSLALGLALLRSPKALGRE